MRLSRSDAWALVCALVLLAVVLSLRFTDRWWWAAPLVTVLALVRPVIVPESERWVIEILGAYHRTLSPGLHVLTVFEHARNRVSTREQTLSITAEETLTKDDILVTLHTKLFFILDGEDPEASYKAAYGVEMEGGTIDTAMTNIAQTTLRSVIGSLSFDEATDNQLGIDVRVREQVREGVANWGQVVRRHSITEFIPPKSIREALQAKVDAEKDGLGIIAAAEAAMKARIAKAEGDKKAEILAAEALQQKQILDAEGEARGIALRAEQLKTEEGRAAAAYNIREQEVAAIAGLAQKATTMVITPDLSTVAGLTGAGVKFLETLQQKPRAPEPNP